MQQGGKGGKEGGGLQVIYPDDERVVLDKVENDCTEILELDGIIYGMDIKMVIVGGEKNVFFGRIFGSPLSIAALISIQHGDIFSFTKKCGFTPYQWPFMN